MAAGLEIPLAVLVFWSHTELTYSPQSKTYCESALLMPLQWTEHDKMTLPTNYFYINVLVPFSHRLGLSKCTYVSVILRTKMSLLTWSLMEDCQLKDELGN